MSFIMNLCFCRKSNADEEDGPKTKRPSSSAFKQQKMKAWQPILTASTVLPIFFFFGILFLPIGIALLSASNSVKEKTIPYTDCKNTTNGASCDTADLEAAYKAGNATACKCVKKFTLDEQWDGDVFFYYGLSNFHQNHRRYVKSRDDNQLHGAKKASADSCAPFDKRNVISKQGNISVSTSYPVAPCGAIANSMFNDRFSLVFKKGVSQGVPVKWSGKGIAWKSDVESKFKNPDPESNLTDAFKGFVKPDFWTKNVYELNTIPDSSGNGYLNEDFIVWMRVAAFPTFRKLYRKLVREADFKQGLPKGDYELTIDYNFPVSKFGGGKRFILSTTSWMGGKNDFLGVAYIVVGSLCLVFGFIFLFIHMRVRTREA